jgi:hypothetical protein
MSLLIYRFHCLVFGPCTILEVFPVYLQQLGCMWLGILLWFSFYKGLRREF